MGDLRDQRIQMSRSQIQSSEGADPPFSQAQIPRAETPLIEMSVHQGLPQIVPSISELRRSHRHPEGIRRGLARQMERPRHLYGDQHLRH